MTDPVVTANPALAIFGFLGVVLLLLFLIARWRWHVFLALLVPLLLFGLLPGIQANNFIAAFQSGFGDTLGSIGVVIVLGAIIGEALRHTGAIQTITHSIIRVVGRQRMPLALTLAGFVLGIAIFSDVAFVILNPLVHSAAKMMGAPIAVTATGLVGALQLTHAIVPPTPGPLAAAALVGADIGKTIIYGSIACLVGSMATWIWGQFIAGPRIDVAPSDHFAGGPDAMDSGATAHRPGIVAAYAPIVIPVLLISAQSIAAVFIDADHIIHTMLVFVGWPVAALAIGVGLAYLNIRGAEQRKAAKSAWIEEALRVSAMILIVTGLGGALSEILRGTPAVEAVTAGFVTYGLPPILLPFVIGIIANMITGSTTVGVITAASLVAPALDGLGLSPESAVLAGACGSVIIKYVNSSYFWVCTSATGLRVGQAIFAYGGATLVGGIAAFATVWAMTAAGLI